MKKTLLSIYVAVSMFMIQVVPAFASVPTASFPRQILKTVGIWVSTGVLIAIVVFLGKDIIDVIKGQGSFFSILWKILCCLILIGLIYVLVDFQGDELSQITEQIVDNLPSGF